MCESGGEEVLLAENFSLPTMQHILDWGIGQGEGGRGKVRIAHSTLTTKVRIKLAGIAFLGQTLKS